MVIAEKRETKQMFLANDVLQRMQYLVPPKAQWTPVDEALFGTSDCFHVEKEKAEQSRFRAIKHAFTHHYENSAFYRRYCQADGIEPADIKEPADLLRIPMIPDVFFKDHGEGKAFIEWLRKVYTGRLPLVQVKKNPSYQDILEAFEEKGVTITFTSGTTGKFSFFPRSALTWARQRYAIGATTKEMLGDTYDPDRVMMEFGPSPDKTFAFGGKGVAAIQNAMFDPQNMYYMINNKVTPDSIRIARGFTRGFKEKMLARAGALVEAWMVNQFVQRLERLAEAKRRLMITGFPSLLENAMDILTAKGKKLAFDIQTRVVTGGGWKIRAAGPLPQHEFRERINREWGIADENCRDAYGMSECSVIFPECKAHYKHVPYALIYPLVLGEDLKPLGYGQYGRFAFLDPIPDSYPGFIMTRDRVRLLASCPACDMTGPVFEQDITRVQGAEERGCSSLMRTLMGQHLKEMSAK